MKILMFLFLPLALIGQQDTVLMGVSWGFNYKFSVVYDHHTEDMTLNESIYGVELSKPIGLRTAVKEIMGQLARSRYECSIYFDRQRVKLWRADDNLWVVDYAGRETEFEDPRDGLTFIAGVLTKNL